MDRGLISTIDLIIEDFKFLPQKNSITIWILKNYHPNYFLVVVAVWPLKDVSVTTWFRMTE